MDKLGRFLDSGWTLAVMRVGSYGAWIYVALKILEHLSTHGIPVRIVG